MKEQTRNTEVQINRGNRQSPWKRIKNHDSVGRWEERQRSGTQLREGSRPPRRQDAREEGQLRPGGGEGGAREEIGEAVS